MSVRKKFSDFRSMIYTAINNFEYYNKTALDERPPKNDEEAADVLKRYNQYR